MSSPTTKCERSAHTKRAVFVPSDVKITGHPGLRWQAITSATFTSWEYPSAPQCPHQCHTSWWPCGHAACRTPQLHPYLQSIREAQGGFHSAFGTCIPGIPLGKKHHVHNLGQSSNEFINSRDDTWDEWNLKWTNAGFQAEKSSRPANIMIDFFPPGCSPETRRKFQCENETIHSKKNKKIIQNHSDTLRYIYITNTSLISAFERAMRRIEKGRLRNWKAQECTNIPWEAFMNHGTMNHKQNLHTENLLYML